MKQAGVLPFQLQPVLRSALPEVAAFLYCQRLTEPEGSPTSLSAGETVETIERRLKWLLTDNPLATDETTLGYCVRDSDGMMRGVDLCFPVAFVTSDHRIFGMCSGTFFVDPSARSMGFYLFKKCLNTPGYAFHFAATCNVRSGELWRGIGASPVPNSEMEYILPLRLDMVVAAYVAYRTSSQGAARIARVCGRTVNPIVQFLTRPSSKLTIKACRDWEKLSQLSGLHRSPRHITTDRSPAFLEWRYGPKSPANPCSIYLFSDEHGNEGWFCLGHRRRGGQCQFRASVLLDVIWPREHISYSDVFLQIVAVSAAMSDALSCRWQPGLDYRKYNPCMFPRKLGTPRAFVRVTKGAPNLQLDMFDYDDSDYIAWAFPWRAV